MWIPDVYALAISQRFPSGSHSPLQLETQWKSSLKASEQCQLNSDVSLAPWWQPWSVTWLRWSHISFWILPIMILRRLSNQDWHLSKWPLLMTMLPSFTRVEQILFVTKQVSKGSHLKKSQWKRDCQQWCSALGSYKLDEEIRKNMRPKKRAVLGF